MKNRKFNFRDKNRIEIVKLFHLKSLRKGFAIDIVIGQRRFSSDLVYSHKSSALKTARKIGNEFGFRIFNKDQQNETVY
jgi:hypothetical protein